MVLDPLSAFAVACNIVQIIEVGCKTLSRAAEYRSASDGILTEHQELIVVARTLQNLSNTLSAYTATSLQPAKLTQEEIRLCQANEECCRLSKNFIDFLERLKVKNQHGTLESLRMSIKARWYRDRMDAMRKALSESRENLNLAFLLYMQAQIATNAQTTDQKIANSTVQVGDRILDELNSSSSSIQEEIRKLADQLKENYLDSNEKTATGFAARSQDLLGEILTLLKSNAASEEHERAENAEFYNSATQQKIINSLYFDNMNQRLEQVDDAYVGTYYWMLQPLEHSWQQWDCFITWLQTAKGVQKLYWIHGKPGSGKSTLLRFLYDNISNEHLHPWTGNTDVLKVATFIWNSGSTLQKSLEGLYRSLLHQLLEKCPNSMSQAVDDTKWRVAQLSTSADLRWTERELQKFLTNVVCQLSASHKLLFLIDGLDEFQVSDDKQLELTDFLLNLADRHNVKICITSRPWNCFLDAFGHHPQLRLEDLTRSDITTYMTAQFRSSHRWRLLQEQNQREAELITSIIVERAAGVFLWVRLVVCDLLRGLRDGDELPQLEARLHRTPTDLNVYFARMMDSIDPTYRREASVLLQLALHEETEFETVHSLRLLDISFLQETDVEFPARPNYNFHCLDFTDQKSLSHRIDASLRRLNSRCMGLLQCYHGGDNEASSGEKGGTPIPQQSETTITNLQDLKALSETQHGQVTAGKTEILNLKIDFIHRSARDFLLTSEITNSLYGHTGGPLDCRLFLCSARLVEFVALMRAEENMLVAAMRASHILSALWVLRKSHVCLVLAKIMEKPVTRLADICEFSHKYRMYIEPSLVSWHKEKSNFLTMAIDFRLTTYVLEIMTPQTIQAKAGRPILDYVLRSRFVDYLKFSIGNQLPDMVLLDAALAAGADPNAMYYEQEASVWALFLCFVADNLRLRDKVLTIDHEKLTAACVKALKAMVFAGADSVLPKEWLSGHGKYYRYGELRLDTGTEFDCFKERWPFVSPIQVPNHYRFSTEFYAVSELLQSWNRFFDSRLDSLIEELKSRESRHLNLMSSQNRRMH